MGKASVILKTAGTAVAGTATIIGALKENPQIGEHLAKAFDKVKDVTSSRSPKARFDGKISAIEACADAVSEAFPDSDEPREWRRRAKALRMRGELAWKANRGRDRKVAMKKLNDETSDLLEAVNQRLVAMTNGIEEPEELPEPSAD